MIHTFKRLGRNGLHSRPLLPQSSKPGQVFGGLEDGEKQGLTGNGNGNDIFVFVSLLNFTLLKIYTFIICVTL